MYLFYQHIFLIDPFVCMLNGLYLMIISQGYLYMFLLFFLFYYYYHL